jgi:hypothetical protein
MPDLCPKNHDKMIVGVTKWRRCRECERVRLRKQARERRTRPQPKIRYPNPGKRVRPVTDGLEAEYGPVPDLVPDVRWFDEVIVVRALAKRPTGRRPYPLEWAEIIRRMPRTELTDEEVAEVTGITTNWLDKIRRAQHG